MNRNALLYWCRATAELYKTPIRLYDENALVEEFNFLGKDWGTFSLADGELLRSKSEHTVQFYVDGYYFMYGKIIDKYSSAQIIIGPCVVLQVSQEHIKKLILDNALPLDAAEDLKNVYRRTPVFEALTFVKFLSLANTQINHTVLLPESFAKNDCMASDDVATTLVKEENDVSDAENRHISYEYEQRFLFCIKNGLIDEIGRVDLAGYKGRPGKMSVDPVRQAKSLLLAMNTLCIRAAIEGGVDEETAYTLGEIYAQRIDLCNDYAELNGISQQIRKDYCQRVYDLKYPKASDLTVQKALKYISAHVTEKLSTTDVANELGISKGYLSTRFKAVTGVSVTDYINAQKIREAKQLLKFSDKPLVSISNYLSFSSQSYFQNIFKRLTGKTPTEYRKSKDG